MRLSEQSRQAMRLQSLQDVSSRADMLQRQIASGRKIERASDDPAGAAQALRHRRDIAFETQMRRNLNGGIAFMNATEAALDAATGSLQRGRELTVQGANDTLSVPERRAIGAEVDQLIRHLAQVANSNFGGAYLFSGHTTQTPAYLVTGDPPTSITYQGDAGQRMRRISKQDEAPVNVVGSDAFGTVFDDLIALRDNLDAGADGATIESSLGAIDAALDTMLAARADVGARINRFQSSTSTSEVTGIDLEERRAAIEEVDLADAIVRLSSQQAALEAALGTIGRTSNLTLMNFMR